jgi:hypothetical protein
MASQQAVSQQQCCAARSRPQQRSSYGYGSLGLTIKGGRSSQKLFHCTPKLALRGVTSHLVTDMCMYIHAVVGVSTHDYGRAMVGYICPTHTVSVTYM